jgi:hypothetical protein
MAPRGVDRLHVIGWSEESGSPVSQTAPTTADDYDNSNEALTPVASEVVQQSASGVDFDILMTDPLSMGQSPQSTSEPAGSDVDPGSHDVSDADTRDDDDYLTDPDLEDLYDIVSL